MTWRTFPKYAYRRLVVCDRTAIGWARYLLPVKNHPLDERSRMDYRGIRNPGRESVASFRYQRRFRPPKKICALKLEWKHSQKEDLDVVHRSARERHSLFITDVISCVTWGGNWPRRSRTVFCLESLIPRSTPRSRSVRTTSILPQSAASCIAVPAEVLVLTSTPEARRTSTTALKQGVKQFRWLTVIILVGNWVIFKKPSSRNDKINVRCFLHHKSLYFGSNNIVTIGSTDMTKTLLFWFLLASRIVMVYHENLVTLKKEIPLNFSRPTKWQKNLPWWVANMMWHVIWSTVNW